MASLWLAQAEPMPEQFTRPQVIRPLSGSLDDVFVFNSNSPEIVSRDGVLLSTFPPVDQQHPEAHLNLLIEGRFDIFAHHIAKAEPEDLRTLYLGILAHNPGQTPATIDVLQAASYLSQPDAPFLNLDDWIEDPTGEVYAGPGSRAMGTILRGDRPEGWPEQIQIPPGESHLIMNLPIPVQSLDPKINGRSTLIRLYSDAPIYLASLAQFIDPAEDDSTPPPPDLASWQDILQSGSLVSPRDLTPTPINQAGNVIYGRVAGVAQGARWQTQLRDPDSLRLAVPDPGEALSYGISTLHAGRLGTGQVQSGEMIARYPDTAYQAHGNYAVEYNLSLPLENTSDQPRQVAIALETPIKEDILTEAGLQFFEPLPNRIFFRGPVRIRYTDDQKLPRTRYVHLVQRRGQAAEPLVTLNLQPGEQRLVQVDLLYPPDSTPPQVLTIQTNRL